MRLNLKAANFRLFGPDETASNRLDASFEVSGKVWLDGVQEERNNHLSADQQRTGQPRPARVGNRIDFRQLDIDLFQHLSGQRQHTPDMVAAGVFRRDAAVSLMHVDLAEQRVRQQARHATARGIDQRHASLVTTRFESKYKHCSSLVRASARSAGGCRASAQEERPWKPSSPARAARLALPDRRRRAARRGPSAYCPSLHCTLGAASHSPPGVAPFDTSGRTE